MAKRIFLIVLDSFGIGDAPDAAEYGDEGSNTLAAVAQSSKFHLPNMGRVGLFNIDKVTVGEPFNPTTGAYARLTEKSRGKDTTIGHWEMTGIYSPKPMPTFPDGFPQEMMDEFEKRTGKKALCGKPYSGTEVIKEYGEEHLKTGALIVYTSADSVFQIAAHEEVVPLKELYRYCEIARDMLTGDWAVGRVIARPFLGTNSGDFKRTSNRHDYSLAPPSPTVLDALKENGHDVIGIGKINDIFTGQGITETHPTTSNADGMEKIREISKRDFNGICFTNLVDFDMLYGHRNDIDGYANALSEFDSFLGKFIPMLKKDDMILITADHGCDPSTPSTDHSRECVPLLCVGPAIKGNVNAGTRLSFSTVANIVADYFELPVEYDADHIWPLINAKG